MKKANIILTSILAVAIGCTAAQVQQTETDLGKVLNGALVALNTLEANPTAVKDAEAALSALAAILPPTGVVHQAVVNAQAALVAFQTNGASIDVVKAALQNVVNLLLAQNAIAPVTTGATLRRSYKSN